MCEGCDCELLISENERMKNLLSEWGISDEPPIQIATAPMQEMTVREGDIIRCSRKVGGKEIGILEARVPNKVQKINHVTIYSFTDALGFNNAVAGVFGDAKKGE